MKETQLKKLILDDDFTNIQSLVNEEINLMSILNIAHRELQHSNLLGWLFSPNETHGLDDFFIKEFIKLYFKENEYQDLGNDYSKLSVFDFVNMNFDDVEIRREYKNIDILILSKSNELCILIENKIYAKEGKEQLTKYRNHIEDEFRDYKHKIFIYLSLFEQEISDKEKDNYVLLTYEHIKKLIKLVLDRQTLGINNNTRFVLEQYLQTLKSLMNENEKIEQLAKDLYKKYKPAFDLVFKYASPSQSTLVPNNLVQLIKDEPSIRPFSTSKSYIRFQPNFLYDNIELLKQKGFITEEDNLEKNWLFLFEFHITRQYIYFDMKIGDYVLTSSREKLYELFKNNTDVFSKVIKANGKLRPSWHLVFQKKIITSSEYSKFLDSEEDSLDEKIEKRFKELIHIDLPKIQKVIEDELKK
ncbi:PD-(D/E)XK nuclease family protein [Tenacibaculum sp. TC6]|uniref:PDDEXK-like family protein n=1 Tax=Tenacibaculum sp. TC6 TaxID=3423223 RepID=UPI003D367B9A